MPSLKLKIINSLMLLRTTAAANEILEESLKLLPPFDKK